MQSWIADLKYAWRKLFGASTGGTASAPPPPERAPSVMDKDQAYIAAVERIARIRGIQVQWVNMPRLPRSETDPQDDN